MTAPGAGVVSTTNAANGYKRSSGTGKDTFSPDEGCARAQAVTFLYKASLLET